jgi:hypothetical protein
MKHPEEEILELFVLESEEVKEQRAEIEAHLKECVGCMSLAEEMKEYYSEVNAVHEERTKAVSQALTVRSIAVRVPTYTEFGPLSQIPKTWPARAILFIIRHPAVSAGGFLAFFAAAVLSISTLYTLKDKNISYARARDGFLIAYNKEGDVLWRKEAGAGYDMESLKDKRSPDEYLTTIDVDGDGSLEVIAIYTGFAPIAGVTPPFNSIYCYSKDGTERWKYEIHRNMTFGTEVFPDRYEFVSMAIGDFDKEGTPEVVAVATHSHYPCLLLHFNAKTGEVLHEYWHSGALTDVYHKDIDGDGVEELLFSGQNNSFNLACLLVLDPRTMSGHGPATPAYTPAGVSPGTEMYYLLFPRNDMKTAGLQNRNVAKGIQFYSDGSMQVSVGEIVSIVPTDYRYVLYRFTPSLACNGVDGEDLFVAFHKKLEAEGKLTRKLDAEYWEEQRRGVRYWDGERFTATPTLNKRYLQAQLAKK